MTPTRYDTALQTGATLPGVSPGMLAESSAAPVPRTDQLMSIVIAGHVDHGKSTIIGRLLADTHSLPEGKLEQVRSNCERNAKPFEYAFLLDALRDEQAQGITIDVARIFFRSTQRHYLIIDAPGHIEFLKNMVTGASRAEAALLVIDANEGVQENSRRHGYMMSMLGIRQLAVLINKMDLVNWEPRIYREIVAEYGEFLGRIGLRPQCFVPVCGRDGDNIASRSSAMPWYTGATVLEALDTFEPELPPVQKPLRMLVQGVYKFTNEGDDRRIVAGTIETGRVAVNDEVIFYPSGKKSRVESIEAFNRAPPTQAEAGWAAGLTLGEQIYVTRGEIVALESEPKPKVATRLQVSLFWLGRSALVKGKDYVLKLGTARVKAQLADILGVIDASTLATADQRDAIERHEVADCILKLDRAIACDLAVDNPTTSRFVLVDDFEIAGGGIVRQTLPDQHTAVRDRVLLRNYKWQASVIPGERRAERYHQQAALVLISGSDDVPRKTVAKALEARLFEEGQVVYFLGIGNVLYGVDADIDRRHENRLEHMRRLSEIANLMLDAGVILVVTASEITQEDLEVIRTGVEAERIQTVWIGDHLTTDLVCDLQLSPVPDPEAAVDQLKSHLQDQGIISRP